MSKPSITVVWLKRDFRLQDHEPLARAAALGLPVLVLAFLEPSLDSSPESDVRHWDFVAQSLQQMNAFLHPLGGRVYWLHTEVLPAFERISEVYTLVHLLSYQEIGLSVSYKRDKTVADWCLHAGVRWTEFPYAGVERGRNNRNGWVANWHRVMEASVAEVVLEKIQWAQLPEGVPQTEGYGRRVANRQPGGPMYATRYLKSFCDERWHGYQKNISKPGASRQSCSRLSPYLAWGNLSMRQVYQHWEQQKKQGRNAQAFGSRLRWHCHFIQKFEMEDRMEFEPVNRGYLKMHKPWREGLYSAWRNAETGIPIVDACMRCVQQTGYLNFRMRAMMISVLTHHLWLPWQEGAAFLASQFLDFEPGIHYPQVQMQAGLTGINIIRIYNPVKQSQEQDPDGVFIKEWLPALRELPSTLIHEPWKLTPLEQLAYGFRLGKDFPHPVVNLEAAHRHARDLLYSWKEDPAVKAEGRRILSRHTVPNRSV